MASKNDFALHNPDPRDWRELAAAQGHTGEVEKIDEKDLKENNSDRQPNPEEVGEETSQKVNEVLPVGHNFLSPFQ